RLAEQCRDVDGEGITVDDLDVGAALEAARERAGESVVLLDRDESCDAAGEMIRERAGARADLEYRVVRLGAQRLDDALLVVRVDEEVLAERLLGADHDGQRRTSNAVRSSDGMPGRRLAVARKMRSRIARSGLSRRVTISSTS